MVNGPDWGSPPLTLSTATIRAPACGQTPILISVCPNDLRYSWGVRYLRIKSCRSHTVVPYVHIVIEPRLNVVRHR